MGENRTPVNEVRVLAAGVQDDVEVDLEFSGLWIGAFEWERDRAVVLGNPAEAGDVVVQAHPGDGEGARHEVHLVVGRTGARLGFGGVVLIDESAGSVAVEGN